MLQCGEITTLRQRPWDDAMTYDAVVIGGGFAGVTAARELALRGTRTVLLEARDRLGGKTWTSRFAGRLAEMGGMSIHWFQPHVWSEVTRYGLEIAEFPGTDERRVVCNKSMMRFTTDEAQTRDRELYERVLGEMGHAFDQPYEPLLHDDKVRAMDNISIRSRLEQLSLSKDEEDWLSGPLADYVGGTLEQGALTSLLRWFALAGLDHRLQSDTFTRYRLVNGTATLIDAMATDAPIDILLSSPVAEVDHLEDGVAVYTRQGEVISAAVLVVAVPVNLWPTIAFHPGLPGVHVAAGREGFCAEHMVKMWIEIKGSRERISAHWPAGSPITRIRSEVPLDSGQILVAFSSDPDFNGNDRRALEKAISEVLPGAEIVDWVAHDWGRDEFSRGGATFLGVGQLSTYLHDLQEPVGRVVFATSDLANGWSGFIDGAIESGLRAASHALAAVNEASTKSSST